MPVVSRKLNMYGSFQKLVSIIFTSDGFSQTLTPNVATVYTADRVVELPAVDLDCVLISAAQVSDGYQPLDQRLTDITNLGDGIMVSSGASNGALQVSIEAAADAGLSVANGNGVAGNPSLSLSIANLQSETATLSDKMIFGDVSASDAPKYLTISDLADLIGPGAFGYAETWDNGQIDFAVSHNLDSNDVIVQIYDMVTKDNIMIDQISRVNANQLSLIASEAPPAGTGWRVMVQKVA